MAIIQCGNNHYYDDKRNSTCPYCEKLNLTAVPHNNLNEQLTSYIDPECDEDMQLTEAYGEAVADYERTIGFFSDEPQNLLTVGWLVCVSGLVKGKSYVLHAGRNFAGRAFDMDIVLSDDERLSRKNHFSVVYDPKSCSFYAVSGSGAVEVNGQGLSGERQIFEGDRIQAGQSSYVFVPYCKEGRDWK